VTTRELVGWIVAGFGCVGFVSVQVMRYRRNQAIRMVIEMIANLKLVGRR
jgi:hypothetical protein